MKVILRKQFVKTCETKGKWHIYSRMAHQKNLPLTSLPCNDSQAKNNNKRKPQWPSSVREMNGFIGIRWCRLAREVKMHLIMRRLGRMFEDACT